MVGNKGEIDEDWEGVRRGIGEEEEKRSEEEKEGKDDWEDRSEK